MSARPDWDKFYRSKDHIVGGHLLFWKLISTYVEAAGNVLELGAGIGENVGFLCSKGRYHTLEGSGSAVEMLRKKHPNIMERIVCADFARPWPFKGQFDLICERASVAHNERKDIEATLRNVYDFLAPGGIFVSSDWFSTAHSETLRGTFVGDEGMTRTYEDGQFAGVGPVHFSDELELLTLFEAFEGIWLEERLSTRKARALGRRNVEFPWIAPDFVATDYTSAVWDIVVRRPL